MALAEGGFQVGELAKCYYPGGVMIDDLDYESSLQKTNQLLTKEDAIIFEAAVEFENLFARIDILLKKGNQLHLIEVKSKSLSKTVTETCPRSFRSKEIFVSGLKGLG